MRINDRHSLRELFFAGVVICDHKVNAKLFGKARLFYGGDATVDGHNKTHTLLM